MGDLANKLSRFFVPRKQQWKQLEKGRHRQKPIIQVIWA
jgi:hypothetical protein